MQLSEALKTAKRLSGKTTVYRQNTEIELDPHGETYILTFEETQADDWKIKADRSVIDGAGRTPGQVLTDLIRIHLQDGKCWERIAASFARIIFQNQPACPRCGRLGDQSFDPLDLFAKEGEDPS